MGAGGATAFLLLSYLAESAIKLSGAALHAAAATVNADEAYRWGYAFIRDSGLGTWDRAFSEAFAGNGASLPRELSDVLTWGTQRRKPRRDQWFFEAKEAAREIAALLGLQEQMPDPTNARGLVSLLVYIRNKSKAHGAAGPEFFEAAYWPYHVLIRAFITHCPVMAWDWWYVRKLSDAEIQRVTLVGTEPLVAAGDVAEPHPGPHGSGIAYSVDGTTYPVSTELLDTDRECQHFWFPNGGMRDNGVADRIDYAAGTSETYTPKEFRRAATPLPDSETHGLPELDIQGNVFGNLPDLPAGYVHRPVLEGRLRTLLVDSPYPAITLHGRGGAGKTRLALREAWDLADSDNPPYDTILWFSARNVDLTPTGPRPVQAATSDLDSAAAAFGRFTGSAGTLEDLQAALGAKDNAKHGGTLFIFDNFETVEDKIAAQSFLSDNIRPPNKLLITSRERGFKGDYSLEVSGMERDEASELLRNAASSLGVEGMLDSKTQDRIFKFSEGHAYVMRLLVGEIAVTGKLTGLRQAITKSDHILDTVFERSYSQLSEAGRKVFLTVASWNAVVPEISLLATLAKREINVSAALDECVTLALLEQGEMGDEYSCYWATQLARSFADRKVRGAVDSLEIRADLQELRRFGVIPIGGPRPEQVEVITAFIDRSVLGIAGLSTPERAELDYTLQQLAHEWPAAWLGVITFRRRANFPPDQVLEATKSAVEAMPTSRDAWRARADVAWATEEPVIAIAAEIELADLDPSDLGQLETAANALIGHLRKRERDMPASQRRVYLDRVRNHLVNAAARLTPTALSRLSWLFLLDDNDELAYEYASLGLRTNPHHSGCLSLIEQISARGYRPPREPR